MRDHGRVLRAAGKSQALDQVAMRIREGERVSPVGLNGAGKTSSFNAVSAGFPRRPVDGYGR
jgi:branched-chain amino acid transport system ATP-binding protein